MSILEELQRHEEWEAYYSYKSKNLPPKRAAELRHFIDRRAYMPTVEHILGGGTFSPPVLRQIKKSGTKRLRTVYTYSPEESLCLKLIAYKLRRYDGIFSEDLYSFRERRGVRAALTKILSKTGGEGAYTYKADVSDYFNSIPVERLLPELEAALADDVRLYKFLESLLTFPYAMKDGERDYSPRGVMAGCATASFLSNLYLSELDKRMGTWPEAVYARYSDDIIVFTETAEQRAAAEQMIRGTVLERGLEINPEKECRTEPGEPWVFLGIRYGDGVTDVCPVSVAKLKAKMRRKSRALARWGDRKNVPGEKRALALVRRMNRKLFDLSEEDDMCWCRWYFPLISTDRSLAEIDDYMKECLRFLATGKRGSAKYAFSYEDMKRIGMRSLVHEYWTWRHSELWE